MQAITGELLRDLCDSAEIIEEQEATASRAREAETLAKIDARFRASPLAAPVWLDASADHTSRLSRAIFLIGIILLVATGAVFAGSIIGQAAANLDETMRQVGDGRAKW